MPSDTFRRFLAQLQATGPEKGDGFNGSHFDGLAPDERPEVARLLREAVLAGDTTAAGGLTLFDRAAAPGVLADALARVPFENGVGANVAGELWVLTHDPVYLRELVRYLAHPRRSAASVALSYLGEAPRQPALAPALRAFVQREPDARRRSIGAGLLLYWLGLIPTPDDSYRLRRGFMEAIKQPDAAARERALRELVA